MAFTLQQSPSNGIASAAASSILTVVQPSLGQLLIAGCYLTDSTSVPVISVTDNGSTGWTHIVSAFNYATDSVLVWFYKVATASDVTSLTTVTFSWTNSAGVLGGSCFMDEYHGFIGTPTLDLAPAGVSSGSVTTTTVTGGIASHATELALSMVVSSGSLGASTGTNTYSPNNGTTTYTWTTTTSTVGGSADVISRNWAAPTATPATASKFIMSWTTARGTGAFGATFYDRATAGISRSIASAFPLVAASTTGNTVSIAGVVLGSAGDLVIVETVNSDNLGLSAPPAITATGLTFTLAGTYDATADFNAWAAWYAVIPTAAAGTTVTVTATYAAGTFSGGYASIGVDEMTSDLGVRTVWTFGSFLGITNASSLNIDYPSITTPAIGAEWLYWGGASGNDAGPPSNPINGATFVYDVPSGIAYCGNGLSPSTAYQPIWPQTPAAASDAIGMVFSAALPMAVLTRYPMNAAVKRSGYR